MTSNYSRLRSLEDKRRTRKTFGLLFLTGLVVGLSIFAGQKALTGMFLFISNIKSAGQTAAKEDFIPPGPPQIFLPYEATNSATISVSGYAEPGANVFVTRNSNPLDNIVTAEDGSFVFPDVQLDEGNNSFSAVAVDPAGNKSQASDLEIIYYSNKPPKLVVDSPKNNQAYAGADNFAQVSGSTDPLAKITVNDRQVIVSSTGTFTYKVSLSEGDNKITTVASDSAGNSQLSNLTVTYSH